MQKNKNKFLTIFTTMLSVVFFFVYAPKLLRAAWGMGNNYSYNSEACFMQLTKKNEDGTYVAKCRSIIIIGIIGSLVLLGIFGILIFYICHVSINAWEIMKLAEVIPAGFAALIVLFVMLFLVFYLKGQVDGLRDKVNEANKKISNGIAVDEFGNEMKIEESENLNPKEKQKD